MKSFHCISFNHKNIGIDLIGDFHISIDNQPGRLGRLKDLEVSEFLFLSTCNRVELWLRAEKEMTSELLFEILTEIYPSFSPFQLNNAVEKAWVFSHLEGVNHAFRVASSLESLVIGEREILSQFRDAYHFCRDLGFTGDFIRILYKKTVELAKQVYTETDIATRPVSVVNLAFRQLREFNPSLTSQIVFVGSGKTNQAMAKKMVKVGYSDFTIYNRTLINAKKMQEGFGGEALDLEKLSEHNKPADIVVTCTGSEGHIIDKTILDSLLKKEPQNSNKITVVDLAVPGDVSKDIQSDPRIQYIAIENLKDIAARNLEARRGELEKCELIISQGLVDFESLHKVRQVELVMRKVPIQVKEIRKRATEIVYAKEIAQLDSNSRETLEKVLSFVEKKYMSTPMLLAKEILLQDESK
ncbi:MAG: glutamyl-tRNA reductase [Crocinitomicaceae bacterium]|nr:glutamyl-tRNA reductase [Crocinitomicaceae bacterium]|tara:strand:+ start:50266 stop:51504 length:1239 start_codon:yes stop_codon:yes gene_type:complete